jgi:Tfp pilus assembly protein PilV
MRSSHRHPPRGFFLVEFLLAACILGVGLLGLGTLQVAAARGLAGTWNRLIAATLAGNALETAMAGAEAPRVPRVCRFDRDGRPAAAGPAFFTVTAARSGVAVDWVESAPPVCRRFALNRPLVP